MMRTSIVVVLLMAAAVAGAQDTSDGVDAQMIALDGELASYPDSRVTDVYKFLFQGCFGPGHAITSRAAAADYLTEELAVLGPSGVEDRLCQPLGGAPDLVRIHLRPFVGAGGDPEALVDAFVASAGQVVGDPEVMDRALNKAVTRLIRRSRFQLAGQLEDLASRLAAEGYPAAHHSDRYTANYRPAYRVVLRELAEQYGWCAPVEEP